MDFVYIASYPFIFKCHFGNSAISIWPTPHFLMHCPMLYHLRRNLVRQLSEILSMDVSNFDDDFICSLMLYGNSELPYIVNRMILEATLEYIKSSRRFVSLDYEN